MWSAIKSDLLSFVATIQEDTTKTISKVLGDEEVDDDGSVMQEKIAADVRRSFETYGTAIKESNIKEFNRFKKTFSLGQYANDIGFVLDEEPEVSRFYAELVPAQLTPEEFWSRLFFRLNKVYRSTSANGNLDEDEDEEELVWDAGEDEDDNVKDSTQNLSQSSLSSLNVTSSANDTEGASVTQSQAGKGDAELLAVAQRRLAELEIENSRMKGQIRSLVSRVSELETALQASTKSSSVIPQAAQPVAALSKSPISQISHGKVDTTDSVSVASVDQSSSPVMEAVDHKQKPSVSSDVISQSSRTSSSDSNGSVVVVENNTSDTMSFADEGSAHGVVVASSLSAQTSQFLPAVDDEDDEENGWN